MSDVCVGIDSATATFIGTEHRLFGRSSDDRDKERLNGVLHADSCFVHGDPFLAVLVFFFSCIIQDTSTGAEFGYFELIV